MKIFLDSADLEEIRQAQALGLLDGVTMNPGLLSRAVMSLEDLVGELRDVVQGPLCLPARGEHASALIETARGLAQLDDRVVVKIPLGMEGLQAMQRLRAEGVRTHATLCGSASQALLAAKCGATYVSPFVGRLEELGESGADLVRRILQILRHYDFETQVMVASVRHTAHVEAAAQDGAHACTMPWKILQTLAEHPLTDQLKQDYRDDPKRGT